jgi:hypothetical protein
MNEKWRRLLIAGGAIGVIIGITSAVAYFAHKYFARVLSWAIGFIGGGLIASLIFTKTANFWVAILAFLLTALLISCLLKRITRSMTDN